MSTSHGIANRRLWVMSDLHMEANGAWDPPCRPPHDVVVLAGDVAGNLCDTVAWADRTFDAPVVLVAGNREFWRHDRTHAIFHGRQAAEATGGKVVLLENSEAVVEGIRFLGATLWTNYALYGPDHLDWVMRHCGDVVDDHKWIRSDGVWSSAWDPSDARRVHLRTAEWLRSTAEAAHDGPTVVVTHHAPHPNSVPRCWRGDHCAPSVASDLTYLMGDLDADLWIHGHAHHSFDYQVHRTRVLCNPMGQKGTGPCGGDENPRFDPSLVVDAGRRPSLRDVAA